MDYRIFNTVYRIFSEINNACVYVYMDCVHTGVDYKIFNAVWSSVSSVMHAYTYTWTAWMLEWATGSRKQLHIFSELIMQACVIYADTVT